MATQGENGIVWCTETWNPIRGCSRVSEGCRHCYAERVAHRFSGPGQPYEGLTDHHGRWNGRIADVPGALHQPTRWKRPRRIFVNSMSDLWHDNVPTDVIDEVFAEMARAQHHVFQVLTKRSARMRAYLADPETPRRVADLYHPVWTYGLSIPWPLSHVHVGVSVEDQAAVSRVADLLAAPAAVRWVSAEPLLGPVDLPPGLDWVVVGGESGPGARPMRPEWARALRDQAVARGTPFLFKQWGEHDAGAARVGKKAAGRVLDGRLWDEYPVGR